MLRLGRYADAATESELRALIGTVWAWKRRRPWDRCWVEAGVAAQPGTWAVTDRRRIAPARARIESAGQRSPLRPHQPGDAASASSSMRSSSARVKVAPSPVPCTSRTRRRPS